MCSVELQFFSILCIGNEQDIQHDHQSVFPCRRTAEQEET